jgi:rRNA-processing protein FCF1
MSYKKQMVIDASVVMSAGESKTDIRATRCRKFLTTFLNEDYTLVMTRSIYNEWHDNAPHKARLVAHAKRWYLQFRRSKVVWLKDENIRDEALRAEIAVHPSSRIMTEDVHLIEAAKNADDILISCDNEARKPFSEIAGKVTALLEIVWVDPTSEPASNLWLKNGAPPDEHRKLGYKSND